MSHTFSATNAILLSLLPAIAFAAPIHTRHIYHWHGYGFLPGYHQPPEQRSSLWFEGGSPQHSRLYATLLILRRAVLFRQSRILPWTLQRRQFWPVLDLDAHRADVELWVDASGPSDPRRLLWQWIFRASCLRLPLARAYLLSQLGYLLAQFINGGKIGGALVMFGLQLGAQVPLQRALFAALTEPAHRSRVRGKRGFGRRSPAQAFVSPKCLECLFA